MEAQRLVGDDRHPPQLLVRQVKQTKLLWLCRVEACKVEQVRNAFQRVVDLVRDGARQPADGGQLFTLDQCLFRAALRRHIQGHGRDGLHLAIRSKDRRVVDQPRAERAGLRLQFALQDDVLQSLASRHTLIPLAYAFDPDSNVEH